MSKADLEKLRWTAARLRLNCGENAESAEDIETLYAYAVAGVRLKRWSRRFLFGFGLANAIEEWFDAFDTRKGDAIMERFPRDETSKVAAKWAWYSVFTSSFSVIASLLVAMITVFFLSKQIDALNFSNKVAQLASSSSESALQSQVTELSKGNKFSQQAFADSAISTYMTHLYDEHCVDDSCETVYNARIREASLRGYVRLERSNDSRPKLFKALLDRVNLSGMNLDDADMSNAKMIRVVLGETSFIGTRLVDADVTRAVGSADFTRANLAVGNFSSSHLKDSIFVDACLAQANFTGADLRSANFSGAQLTHARLNGADLSGANFSNAILTDANFTDAKGMEKTDLTTACRDSRTVLPEGIEVRQCTEPMRTIDSCGLLDSN